MKMKKLSTLLLASVLTFSLTTPALAVYDPNKPVSSEDAEQVRLLAAPEENVSTLSDGNGVSGSTGSGVVQDAILYDTGHDLEVIPVSAEDSDLAHYTTVVEDVKTTSEGTTHDMEFTTTSEEVTRTSNEDDAESAQEKADKEENVVKEDSEEANEDTAKEESEETVKEEKTEDKKDEKDNTTTIALVAVLAVVLVLVLVFALRKKSE